MVKKKKQQKFFQVSERNCSKSRRFRRRTWSFFSFRHHKKANLQRLKTINKVLEFYQKQRKIAEYYLELKTEFSIKKECISTKAINFFALSKNSIKHLKEYYPENTIGFSKFCSLRPKWCVSAGKAGTHSVCVCTIHQNVILLLLAAQIEESNKDLLKMAVCDDHNKDCMLQRCSLCPGF